MLAAVSSLAGPGTAAASGEDEIHYTIISPTAVTLDWRGASSSISYGLTTSYGLSGVATTPSPLPFSSSGPFWEIRLTNLQPYTIYHFAIGGGADHTFRTGLPKGQSGFTINAIADIGDSANYSSIIPAVMQMVAADRPDFVLVPGDLT